MRAEADRMSRRRASARNLGAENGKAASPWRPVSRIYFRWGLSSPPEDRDK